MIIGIDATQANKKRKTGTEWYAYHMIQEFKRLIPPEHKVVLYSPEPLRGELAKLPEHFSSRVLSWPLGFLFNHLRLSWELLWHSVDLLFIPSHVIPLIHPAKTVTTIHDVGFEEDQNLYNSARLGPSNPILSYLLGLLVRAMTLGKYSNTEYDYHRFGARFAAANASHIFTISEFSKQCIQRHYNVADDRITVAPPTTNKGNYSQRIADDDAQKILAHHGVTSPFFFYIGRLEEKKNTLNLVKAFHQFLQKTNAPHALVLVGGEGYGYEKVREYVRTNGLVDRVIRPGYVEEEDVPALFQQATAFVFPSRYEGFGIPPLHAFEAQTPVLASKAASIPEVVGNAALLTDPEDTNGLAANMQRIVEDQELRERLVQRGTKQLETFSNHITASKTWQTIQEVAQKR